jgi:hypothetical protein
MLRNIWKDFDSLNENLNKIWQLLDYWKYSIVESTTTAPSRVKCERWYLSRHFHLIINYMFKDLKELKFLNMFL